MTLVSPLPKHRPVAVTAERGQALRRLEDLYEISKLFASFENAEQIFVPALDIVTRTLPLRSAVLIEAQDDRATLSVWPSERLDSEQMRAVKEHVEGAYATLVGASLMATPQLDPVGTNEAVAKRFVVLPLVVADRLPFGALQLEGDGPLDETDLIFVNAIANQLAIALDRDRAWRRDITRREHAEERGTHAEEQSARAEQHRINAESASGTFAALAAENARLYQEARQAVSVREQILAVVSHDLRNPLGAILLTTSALAKKGALPSAVARIQRSAERMRRLIDDLLDFASIEAGHLAIKRQPQEPGPMIQEALASFEGVVEEKSLRITVDAGPNPPKIYCDRDRILQVFANLVGNATKAIREGGHITIRVEPLGQELLFSVSDDGPGISQEDRQHLFERYWRSDGVEYRGTGLGLAIARGIVTAHAGRIWVESEVGHGATFFFTVPLADLTLLFAVPAPDVAAPADGVTSMRSANGT